MPLLVPTKYEMLLMSITNPHNSFLPISITALPGVDIDIDNTGSALIEKCPVVSP